MNSYTGKQFGANLAQAQINQINRFRLNGDLISEPFFRLMLLLTQRYELDKLERSTPQEMTQPRLKLIRITPDAPMRTFIQGVWQQNQTTTVDYCIQLSRQLKRSPTIASPDACFKALSTLKVKRITPMEAFTAVQTRLSNAETRAYLWKLHEQGRIYLHGGKRDGHRQIKIGERRCTFIEFLNS